jgi:hypothetical protein
MATAGKLIYDNLVTDELKGQIPPIPFLKRNIERLVSNITAEDIYDSIELGFRRKSENKESNINDIIFNDFYDKKVGIPFIKGTAKEAYDNSNIHAFIEEFIILKKHRIQVLSYFSALTYELIVSLMDEFWPSNNNPEGRAQLLENFKAVKDTRVIAVGGAPALSPALVQVPLGPANIQTRIRANLKQIIKFRYITEPKVYNINWDYPIDTIFNIIDNEQYLEQFNIVISNYVADQTNSQKEQTFLQLWRDIFITGIMQKFGINDEARKADFIRRFEPFFRKARLYDLYYYYMDQWWQDSWFSPHKYINYTIKKEYNSINRNIRQNFTRRTARTRALKLRKNRRTRKTN